MQRQSDVRTVLVRYIGEIANSCEGITGTPAKKVYDALMKQVKRKTAEADAILDEEGKVIGSLEDDDVVIVEDRQAGGEQIEDTLFGNETAAPRRRKKNTKRKKRVA
jgi:hypothetical protein